MRTNESWYQCYICWHRLYYQFMDIVLCCRYYFEIMMLWCCTLICGYDCLVAHISFRYYALLQYLVKDIFCVNADIDWRLSWYHCFVAYATSWGMRVFLFILSFYPDEVTHSLHEQRVEAIKDQKLKGRAANLPDLNWTIIIEILISLVVYLTLKTGTCLFLFSIKFYDAIS